MKKASIEFLDEVCLSVLQAVGSPFAENVKSLIARGDWDGLTQLWVDPSHYTEAESYLRDAQALAMISKIEPDAKRRRSTKAKALSDFQSAEMHCFKTNMRLDKYVNNGPFEASDIAILGHIDSIRARIKGLLGPLPKRLSKCGFGKGATFDDRGTEATLFHKITSRPTVTEAARCLLVYFYESMWGRSLVAEQPNRSDPDTVRGNRFSTALKNIKTDRAVCIEASINLYLQKGVGEEFRRVLRKVGLDLDKIQHVHRRLAEEASLTGLRSTIDLSQASDLIAYLLVKLLFPGDWFAVLDSLRAEFTYVSDGKRTGWYKQEKFSSMGNGFTFELMTLLLWAICKEANPEGFVSVYGDDIIVETQSASDVLSILKFFGFKPNEKKTFTTGSFRESCGGDYFQGQAVRPYFRKVVPTEPHEWIALANGLRRAAISIESAGCRPWTHILDTDFRKPWLKALDQLPVHIRSIRGPESLGDLVIHDDDQTRWQIRSAVGLTPRRYYDEKLEKFVLDKGPFPCEDEIKVYRPVSKKLPIERLSPEAQLAVALYGVDSQGYAPRGAVSGYRTAWVACIERDLVPARSA